MTGPCDTVACIGLLMFVDVATAQRHGAGLRDLVEPGRGGADWAVRHHAVQDFPAPRGLPNRFETLVVRKPACACRAALSAAVCPVRPCSGLGSRADG